VARATPRGARLGPPSPRPLSPPLVALVALVAAAAAAIAAALFAALIAAALAAAIAAAVIAAAAAAIAATIATAALPRTCWLCLPRHFGPPNPPLSIALALARAIVCAHARDESGGLCRRSALFVVVS
jgi:hypothetical protein